MTATHFCIGCGTLSYFGQDLWLDTIGSCEAGGTCVPIPIADAEELTGTFPLQSVEGDTE